MEFCDLRTEFAVRVRGTALECGNRSDVLATSARDYLRLMCASQENGGWIARNFDSFQEKPIMTANLGVAETSLLKNSALCGLGR
jgi:hypothetical protein